MIKNKSEYVNAKNRLVRKLQVLKSMISNNYTLEIVDIITAIKQSKWGTDYIHNIDYRVLFDCKLNPICDDIEELERYVINIYNRQCTDYDTKFNLVKNAYIIIDNMQYNEKLQPLQRQINDLRSTLDGLMVASQFSTTVQFKKRCHNAIKASYQYNLYNDVILDIYKLFSVFCDLYNFENGFKYDLI